MPQSSSKHREEYERRLHRVLTHIDANLDQPIDLAGLAQVASFSAFHFHRLFAAHVGEPLGAYLTRRRVEVAAARLAAQPRLSVLHAALGVGFGSPEAFTRAFKQRFGAAPSVWRASPRPRSGEESKLDQVNRKRSQVKRAEIRYAVPMNSTSFRPLPVVVTSVPAARVAYLRYQGPFGEPLGRFWGEQFYPWLMANQLGGRDRFGISLDDPQLTAQGKCRYDAGVAVDADFVPNRGAQIVTLAGGLCAVATFRGPPQEYPRAWDWILREWLPSSGYQLDARPCVEFYPAKGDCDEATGAVTCELRAPITKL